MVKPFRARAFSCGCWLTHGCVDLIEQGTICKDGGKDFWLSSREKKRSSEREREKKESNKKRVGREEANCFERRARGVNAKPHSASLRSVHLEAKHPELVRRRVELRVHRHLLLPLVVLLLMEVLLVRVREGRRRVGRGLILVFLGQREKRESKRERDE